MVVRKDAACGLAENSSRHRFSMACTQGILSIKEGYSELKGVNQVSAVWQYSSKNFVSTDTVKDQRPLTVLGGEHEDKVASR